MNRSKIPCIAAALGLIAGFGASNGALADPAPDVVRTPAGCQRRIVRVPKRRRCLACVKRGFHFHKRGAGGFCHKPGRLSPATKAVVADRIRSVKGCAIRVPRLSKRKRCVACVKSGRVFQKQVATAGFCVAGPGPGAAAAAVVATAIRHPVGCKTRIARLPKRQRCIACVNRGFVFQRQGAAAGFCRKPGAAPVAATVAATAIRTPAGCRTRIARLPKRQRCVACVRRGQIFQKQGTNPGFCRAPTPPPQAGGNAIFGVAGCKTRIAQVPKQRRCVACVSRPGHVFMKQGARRGFCRRR
jgi:hypothetical protein